MGKQIILKDNGKFAIYSTIVDDFLLDDATETQVLEFYLEECKDEVTFGISRTINALKAGKNPYFQFKMTYEEAKELARLNKND